MQRQDRQLFYAQILINLLAPWIAQQALRVSQDKKIVDALANRETVALIDLQLQLGIVCVSSVILFLSTWGRSGYSVKFIRVCRIASTVTGLCILGLFMGGGARLLTLNPYIKHEPSGAWWQMLIGGVLYIAPPLSSWLTWVRVLIVSLSFVVEYLEMHERKSNA